MSEIWKIWGSGARSDLMGRARWAHGIELRFTLIYFECLTVEGVDRGGHGLGSVGGEGRAWDLEYLPTYLGIEVRDYGYWKVVFRCFGILWVMTGCFDVPVSCFMENG